MFCFFFPAAAAAQKYSSKVAISNFGLRFPKAAQVMERKKIINRSILEKQRDLGLKYFHWGKYIKERHIDLLKYRFSY